MAKVNGTPLFQEIGCFSISVFATAFGYHDKLKYHPLSLSQKHKKRIFLCERSAFLFGKCIIKIDTTLSLVAVLHG